MVNAIALAVMERQEVVVQTVNFLIPRKHFKERMKRGIRIIANGEKELENTI